MQNFIQIANQLGKQKVPFLFIIDFEQQKPLIVPITEVNTSGMMFEFFCKNNLNKKPIITKPFEFSFIPMEYAKYKKGFELVKNHIQAGNSYLLNLTYPTQINTNYNLEELFFSAKAKYKLLLKEQFVCFSPETFVRIENNKIYSYPMKGTINANLPNAKHTLLNCKKEIAEHNTIVDLIRNDLSIVAKNIEVTKYRYLEKLNTYKGAIYQTSSEICGELSTNWQNEIGTILAKLLPAGSVSGAPKEKTVQIIQQAEKQSRGYYTGVFGYFDGEYLDSAVAIRYIEKQGTKLIFRSGGGITSQSNIDDEYNEILEKVYVPIPSI
ncbi:aminodeoxychorismate synthase component I [Pasteurella atlantica]|uniref:aminodeoxychorismate synthase component I n=1 Tax=Pasteurellaceae TaxID=712 RepID=UPI0027660C19|nr:aminodeoxychorismate synthase component I [Pasteurella atlantica]MDP8099271.1 aminodeoxychorismate synthase component I [Pasteurella atlantica]MDP8106170.1 aminodeoxychorismate synthase component I [Pasteurella atlantica]MDP8115895.1 aminodeoxychorismate synthase component I [Pasteurella atlantica]